MSFNPSLSPMCSKLTQYNNKPACAVHNNWKDKQNFIHVYRCIGNAIICHCFMCTLLVSCSPINLTISAMTLLFSLKRSISACKALIFRLHPHVQSHTHSDRCSAWTCGEHATVIIVYMYSFMPVSCMHVIYDVANLPWAEF